MKLIRIISFAVLLGFVSASGIAQASGGVKGFYWSNGWLAPIGGPPGTVNYVTMSDGSDNTVLATAAASGAPLSRVTDVEADLQRNVLYFTNWRSRASNADEAIYRIGLDGSNQVLFSGASSSRTGFATGLHRLAVDPQNGDVYFTRAVSFANPNEISKVDLSGTYTHLIGANSGWFYSGIALDNTNGKVYFGDGGVLIYPPPNGALNVMTKTGASPAVLVPWGITGTSDGMGKTVAFDANAGSAGIVFFSGWRIADIFRGPGAGGTIGQIFAYDVGSGGLTRIYYDPGHGIPDIEVDPAAQRLYWTDYVRGEIRSSNYDGSGMVTEVSGLLNPFGLALDFNNAPVCDDAYPSIDTIWPPNHKFVSVDILGVTDPDGDQVDITIDSIFQDEPVDTFGDGAFAPDGQGIGTATAAVRGERNGSKKVPGNGRFYHVGFTAADGYGASCTDSVAVSVPHDNAHAPVDDGELYDSTAF
jgi:hypothetical protein